MTIVEFLLARYDDAHDSAWEADRFEPVDVRFRSALHALESIDAGMGRHLAYHPPAHDLRDIDAKRRIVSLHSVQSGTGGDWDTDPPAMCTECNHELHPCQTLRLLAAPFAPHPDYDPAWKPSS